MIIYKFSQEMYKQKGSYMGILKSIDGNKTYIMTIIGGMFIVIHFIVTGDYSWAAMLQLGQNSSIVAMIAALRHGVQKAQDAGNGGNLTGGVQK